MRELMKSLRPELTAEQLTRFEIYYSMLNDWNSRINLTAITEKEDVAKKHFVDSLSALPLLRPGMRVVDVGTGAGFPGVPLLICNPSFSLTLMDSMGKRLTFLEALLKELGLNAVLVHIRAEEAGRQSAYRERFDLALSRAVASLPVLLEWTVPLIQTGGMAVAYKGDVSQELRSASSAARALRVRLSVERLTADYGERSLVLALKTGPTPEAYPRPMAQIAKKSL